VEWKGAAETVTVLATEADATDVIMVIEATAVMVMATDHLVLVASLRVFFEG
jgi:hypothetical protein